VLQKLGMTPAGTAQFGNVCADRYVLDRPGDDVRVERVEARPLAVVRRQATQAELSRVVPQALGEVWTVVRARSLPAGRNVALYLDGPKVLECGVEVSGPFAGEGAVFASATPAGLTATAVHVGPYGRLHETYEALHRWCKERGHTFAGPFWEVYGHHCEDEAHLRVEVRYLLREG
jgi:effector-binding domain-containing protein